MLRPCRSAGSAAVRIRVKRRGGPQNRDPVRGHLESAARVTTTLGHVLSVDIPDDPTFLFQPVECPVQCPSRDAPAGQRLQALTKRVDGHVVPQLPGDLQDGEEDELLELAEEDGDRHDEVSVLGFDAKTETSIAPALPRRRRAPYSLASDCHHSARRAYCAARWVSPRSSCASAAAKLVYAYCMRMSVVAASTQGIDGSRMRPRRR
jgi:hypothetical protein